MYSYRLSKNKDFDFFSAPHYDAISTGLIKDGDVVCVCDSCEELFLESSWEANDKHCCKCGGTARKNIDERYFCKFRINTQRVLKTRNRGTVSKRRRNMISLGTVDRPTQPVSTVTRRPATYDFTGTGSRFVAVNNTSRRSTGTVRTTDRPRQTISPQPYPPRKKRRRKIGRILLGIVISLILIAIAVGILFVLDHNGVIDISGTISFLSTCVGIKSTPKGLVAVIADKPYFKLFDYSWLA